MKLQHLAIIFVIIILPISMVISLYIQTQIDTISLQRVYNTKLQTATYDAIKAFQLNTLNNKYSTVSDSKIRDIEASVSTFYNSLGFEMGASGYDKESMQQFIPAIVYTMYDGYYIYGKYYNDNEQEYQFGLRPYIYYSCRYIKGSNYDFVVNYTLDNYITIYGKVNGEYVTKSGPLIDPSLVEVVNEKLVYYGKADGEKVNIKPEILKEQLIILDSNRQPQSSEPQYYEYITYQNKKIYFDGVGNYFWYDNNQKKIITDTDTLKFVNKWTYDGHLHSNSAIEYYKTAKQFSTWVIDNLKYIEQEHAKDLNGNAITDFAIDTGNEKIFDFSETNNPFLDSSTFNQNRISVIRRVIQTTLNTAIANYSSVANYEFAMPVLLEEDWEKLVNNISVVSFMQGVPIGAKYYNNYCVVANNKNKEVVQKDSIYVITDDDNNGINTNSDEAHIASSKDIINKNIIEAYRNIDFEAQSVVRSEGNEVYYYPHANNKCYNCMINVTPTYNIDDIIEGNIKQYNKDIDEYEVDNNISNSNEFKKLRKIYLTALAREKYDLYEGVRLEEIAEVYSEEPIIISVMPIKPTTATINAQGAKQIVGYAITQSPTVPTEFRLCDPRMEANIIASGLEPNQIYYAWVKDSENHISNYKQFATTVLKPEDINFTLTPNTWTNGNVQVMAYSQIEDFNELQTSKDGINYQNQSVQTFTENGTMYARFTRRPDIVASINITTIDKESPKVIDVISRLYSAEIIATDNASGIVGYAITVTDVKPTIDSVSFVECERTNNLKVLASDLVPNKVYYAWVKDAAGNISDEPYKFETGAVTGKIYFGDVIWDSNTHKASISINTNTIYKTKYQINDINGAWIESNNVTNLNLNDIIYACLSDGTNNGDYISLKISDRILPEDSTITLSETSATIKSSVDATITHIDNQSGVDIERCKWVYNTNEKIIGTDASKYKGGTFSKNNETITLKVTTTGNYYLHVLTIDKAGNAKETISEKIKVTLEPNIVTYYVDTDKSYQEWVGNGDTCLEPKTFTPQKEGWTFVGWRENISASGEVLTKKEMQTDPISLYAVFKKDVTVSYYNNKITTDHITKQKYYNNGNIKNPTFTIEQAEKDGWTKIGWSDSEEGNGEILYTLIEDTEISENVTLFAIYRRVITAYYYNGDDSLKSQSDTIQYNSNGAEEYLGITIEQAEKDGWTKRGWSVISLGNEIEEDEIMTKTDEKVADDQITYISINKIQFTENVLLFAMYEKTVTVKYYNNTTTESEQSGIAYCNSVNVKNPTFTIEQVERGEWNKRGWGTDEIAEASVVYSEINNTEIASDVTLYGLYYKTITLLYDGNEATEGSIEAQKENAYYNSKGDTKNPTFTIESNEFTKTGYKFVNWALGSLDGTQYSPGTTIELSADNTLYAIWEIDIIDKYILQTEDTHGSYYWTRQVKPANGWGEGTASPALKDLVTFDCTNYKYCKVRVKGNITSTPSSQTVNHAYIRLGFGTYTNAANIVHKSRAASPDGNGGETTHWQKQEGCLDENDTSLGYTKFGELVLDISGLTGEQTLKMFCGGAWQNGGYLYISEIYLYN